MINTLSAWTYGHTIDDTNFVLNFNEGSGELKAELNAGTYTLGEFANEAARALTEAGTLEYSASVDRSTRKITVSAGSNFTLLVSSGSQSGISAYSLLGFTGSDRSGSSSYEGDEASGKIYQPQFLLQSFIDFQDSKRAVSGTTNQSASGDNVEIVKFGRVRFMRCNIRYITEYVQSAGSEFENDPQAFSNIRDFLDYAIDKGRMEFAPDRDNLGTFNKCLLEATPESDQGLGYDLKEMYDQGLAGWFETGVLTFREVS